MNIYITARHRRPFLYGTTNTEIEVARALGFEVELFLHPGGRKEWAICLRRQDDPYLLKDWQPVWMATAAKESLSSQREAGATDHAVSVDRIFDGSSMGGITDLPRPL